MMDDPKENTRVPFDEDDGNGLLIEGQYIPEELLSQLLCYVDYRSLCQCQVVCKRWNNLIQDYVWRKKAEMILERPFPANSDIPWNVYYFICTKKVFNRNLIKNHSGKKRFSEWIITENGGDKWTVENPPLGVEPLPDDAVLQGAQDCFVTSYGLCEKLQIIDLLKEGYSEYLLDVIQPPIHVSEWYSCRWDCEAMYSCEVELIPGRRASADTVLDRHTFSTSIVNEDQNQWFRFEHEFKNYGEGLRKIKFRHAGQDRRFWAGHYGSKMAGACVSFNLPDSLRQHIEAKPLDLALDPKLED